MKKLQILGTNVAPKSLPLNITFHIVGGEEVNDEKDHISFKKKVLQQNLF
jgi:hypothetical protein